MTMQKVPSAMKLRPEWQTEAIRLSVLYLLVECQQRLQLSADRNTNIGFIENELAEMMALGLIEIKHCKWIETDVDSGKPINVEGEAWVATDKGKEVLGKVVAMFDNLMKFEIFGGVRLTRGLTEDECLEDNPFQCRDHVYDPRFLDPKDDDPDATDLRIAMMTFLSEQMCDQIGGVVDPHRVVFLQKLASGRFKGKDFWFDLRLGTFFKEVEEIVASAYQWQQISDDGDQAIEVMRALYTAGMFEQRKRDGSECSACHIPLAIFQIGAKQEGRTLTECPNPGCRADYNPPAPAGAEQECPQCHADIFPQQRTCTGCGAIIDRRYRAGTVNEETVATTVSETVYDPYYDTWGYGYGYYGYSPYGYYNPWDPFVDAVAFGCLCAVLW